MPEKVHKKFDDGESNLVNIQKNFDSRGSLRSPRTNVVTPSHKFQVRQANGTKRHRDGSPKSKSNLTLKQDSGLESAQIHTPNANSNGFTTAPIKTDLNGIVHKAEPGKPKGFKNSSNATSNPNARGYRDLNSHLSKKTKPLPPRRDLQKVAAELEKTRKTLPIWSKKQDIRWSLRNHDILLLNGETGSGKSTQVPQFIYTEPWCRKQRVRVVDEDGKDEDLSVGGMIAITQPRRVAAMTLAHRVAREIGSPLGHKMEPGKVGYSVRFESHVPPGTKIKFVTEGTLLQEMLRDPHLRQYSAIIVDEIHERSVDVDLICGFLRQLLRGDKKGRGGIPLKVVLMSATLDLGGLEAFFARPEMVPAYQPGRNHGNTFSPHLLEDTAGVDEELEADKSTDTFSSWDGIVSSDDEELKQPAKSKPKAFPEPRKQPLTPKPAQISTGYSDSESMDLLDEKSRKLLEGIAENGVSYIFVEGRQHKVDILYNVTPPQDYLHDMLQTIFKIHITEPMPGDILAFLTGQEEIENLKTQIEVYGERLVKTLPRIKAMPLYGSLSAQAQQDVFEKLKEPNTRKIVLATNIAETSVTVPGVRFVIDCGKSKVKQYRPRLGMESLLSKPISRVSAIQRAGRAGREAKGKCYRLYTEADYMKLEQDEKPEILRTDVIEAVLKMKARGVADVLSFALMDSPDVVAMEKALIQLHAIGAIGDAGELTKAGRQIASFPLSATYGRVLIAAADSEEEDLLLNVIDIVSCLTTDGEIFQQPKAEEEREEVQAARREILARDGDVMTYLYAMQHYAAENTDRNAWCHKRLISTRGMKMAMAIRKQLRQICIQQKLLKALPLADPQPVDPTITTPKRIELILKTFLTAFVTRTAMLGPDGNYTTIQGRHTITVHPSSVLYGRKVEAIMFLENVFTAKNYAKKVSAVQADWITGALGI